MSYISYLWLLALLEESLLALLVVGLLLGEVLVRGHLLELGRVNAGNVNLLGGSDHVAGVDSSERNTVDLEGTGDKENSLREGLEENDTLATETTSEEDQDSTGDEGCAWSRGSDGLADLRVKMLVSSFTNAYR